MRLIRVGVQQADCDRLDALASKPLEDLRQAVQVERLALSPIVRQTPRHLAPQIARNEGIGLLVREIEMIRPVAARDLQRVAKAFARDQRGLDALALGQRIDDQRRAVREEADVRRRDAALRHDVEHAAFEVRRRRIGFGGDDLLRAGAGIRGEVDEVGEGSPDVGRGADRCYLQGRLHS